MTLTTMRRKERRFDGWVKQSLLFYKISIKFMIKNKKKQWVERTIKN